MGGGSKSKKRKITQGTGSDEDAGIYTVEVILKARVASAKKRKWEYYVKWAGYDTDSNTWEPESNLSQCERLLQSFWDNVGMDWDDYPEGHECMPDPKWIGAERKRFWQEITPEERERYLAKEEECRRETQRRKMLEPAAEEPLASSEPPSPKIKPVSVPRKRRKKKVKRPPIAVVESDSDSDIPLAQEKLMLRIPAKRKRIEGSSASEDKPSKLSGHKTKVLKTHTPKTVQELFHSDDALLPQQDPTETDSSEQGALDKGKQKETINEPSPKSPSSLFSIDSADEAAVLTPRPKPEVPPMPERKPFVSSSSRASNTKPSPVVPAKIPYRSTNPHSRLMEGPSVFTAPPSGISTKQKLAQLALAPVNPKEAKSRSTLFKSGTLDSLRFKKTPSSTNTVFVPDGSTSESPTTLTQDLTLNALNTGLGNDYHSTLQEFSSTMSPVAMEPSHDDSRFMAQSVSELAADEFLASMTELMPGFSAPLEPTIEPTFEPKPPPSLVTRKSTVVSGKIPKKWRWEGPLFLLKPNDDEDLIGTVVCTNVTSPKPRGMRIPLTFESMERLNFLSFHDVSDAPIFLEACKSSDQYATLSALDGETLSAFRTVVEYMIRHEKIALVPVWYEKNIVGHLLIFPSAFHDLVKQLEVPSDLSTHVADTLIVSLHGWILNPAACKEESRIPFSDTIPAKPSLGPTFDNHKRASHGQPGPRLDWTSSLHNNVALHLALRVLRFPPDLYEWLTTNFRQYAIHHESEKAEDRSEHVELGMLKRILDACQAQEWKHAPHDSKKEIRLRVVFIHAGSVRKFYRSPLIHKRASLDVRFYTYGTDWSVPRHMWGIREIYPIGGVVTFFPSAFIDNFSSTMRLIRKINEHPLWMAFVTQSCLGYLVNYTCKDQDPLALFGQQGNAFVYHSLLTAIAEGEVALLNAPPESTVYAENKSWFHEHCSIINSLGALSAGTAALNSLCANAPQDDWLKVVQQNITRDILVFQRHPAIIYEYRRFVVVKSEDDKGNLPSSLETAAPSSFNFSDDYFRQGFYPQYLTH